MLLNNFAKLLFLLFFVSAVSEASKLTINRATSDSVRFRFWANCVVDGDLSAGDTCRTTWTVPPGWRYTIVRHISGDNNICFNNPVQTHSFSVYPGAVLYAGQTLSTTAKTTQPIRWLNSALCKVGYAVDAVMVDESIARGTYMPISYTTSANFKWGVLTNAQVKNNSWSQEILSAYSYPMRDVAYAAGSVRSVTLDVVDNINMRPGDVKRLFTVDYGNTGSGTVRITKSGDIAADIDVYKNGSSAKGCDGTFQAGGEYCDVRAVTSPGWYGVRQGVININLTIN
ncbi:hypothetical protein ACQFME_002732 [Escherichia coli]|uniref:hypothetical protein n=1 Tax=Escherichia coli TaxID=562 RepID=UPI0012FF9505|nr:hypothetical protein [Escherichia coli]ELU9693575.1 hypothetical protein [Escherichia coli]ELU9780675.1 hypothetical protein [Escherichia coli]HAH9220754.1 hypothetical protein [Escherichia coli]HDX5705490.1 hypothetical protein [Escherichia coli]